MFIKTLLVIYSLLVAALFIVFFTNQRKRIVRWAENRGLKNNFLIRVIRKRPKKKDESKSDISKVFYK